MATIILERPETGTTKKFEITENVTDLEFAFDISDASMGKVGDGFEFSFEDGSAILLENFYTVYTADFMPNFIIDGYSMTGEEFFSMDTSLLPGSLEALYNHGTTPTYKIGKVAPSTEKVVKVDKSMHYIEILNGYAENIIRENDDFILQFEDGASIRLENFYKVYNADFLPSFVFYGEVTTCDIIFGFINPKLAPKGFFPPDVEAKIFDESSSLDNNFEKYKNFVEINTSLEHISYNENELIIQNNALMPSPTMTLAMLFALAVKTISSFGKC